MFVRASDPPTAAREPEAFFEPAVESEANVPKLAAPGREKRSVWEVVAVAEVRKPAVVRAETSAGVKFIPETVVDVGLSLKSERYLAS